MRVDRAVTLVLPEVRVPVRAGTTLDAVAFALIVMVVPLVAVTVVPAGMPDPVGPAIV